MPEWIVAINSGHAPLLPREGGKVYLLKYYELVGFSDSLKNLEKIISRLCWRHFKAEQEPVTEKGTLADARDF